MERVLAAFGVATGITTGGLVIAFVAWRLYERSWRWR